MPPAAYTHLNVPVLMRQTAAAIARWGELQKHLDVTSEEAAANLSAQAQIRASLKRDLTNLTHLADAQTKHTQKVHKMRQMQAMAMKAPAHGGFRAGGGGGVGGAMGVTAVQARGGTPTVEGYGSSPPELQVTMQQQQQQQQQQPQGVLAAGAALDSAGLANPPPPYATGALESTELAQQGGAGDGPGAPQAQGGNLRGIRQRIECTEPVNKWAVLVEGALRLPPGDGAAFKQLTYMSQNLLSNYNGDVGAEVARALGTCLDPRVFDPADIKRAQERMADMYARFRRSQR